MYRAVFNRVLKAVRKLLWFWFYYGVRLAEQCNDIIVIAPAGFWPRGQNPRRHYCSPRVNRMNIQSTLPDEISSWLK